MTAVFVLGGRVFSPAVASTTYIHDAYLMGLMYQHEIHKAPDLLRAVLASGVPDQFLAGLLTEDEKPWNRDDAKANAKFFAELTDPEDKQALNAALMTLLDFLESGGSSSTASPTSSSEAADSPAPPRRTRRARKPMVSSASGPTSAPLSPPTPTSA